MSEKLFPISSPVPMGLYPPLAVAFLGSGLTGTAMFFLYEVTKTRHNRSLQIEFVLALMSSIMLGAGTLFLLLWTGVYV